MTAGNSRDGRLSADVSREVALASAEPSEPESEKVTESGFASCRIVYWPSGIVSRVWCLVSRASWLVSRVSRVSWLVSGVSRVSCIVDRGSCIEYRVSCVMCRVCPARGDDWHE